MAAELTWKRSSHSTGGDASCVECASDGRAVWVRDSKDVVDRRFEVPLGAWRAFLSFVRP
ncbi:DUF397 domain-containing protein [Lentzea sp. NPDC051838]|uniref:DUF397 domain-containing protein n=1 Tax=Lentzea sp. NPDC051838 TaxID=3154849 RepID=UPI00341DF081